MSADRHIILIPMGGAPRLLPAASNTSLLDQLEDLVGGHVSAIPAPEWLGDRHHAVVACHPQVGIASRANALAGRVLGVPMHGPCVLLRRPIDDSDLYRQERESSRRFTAFDSNSAREALASLGREIEQMHDGPKD